MSLTTATGIALILSTLIYHGGLAYLFARAEFGDVLPLPRGEKLLIIARHPDEYRWGCRIILAGWIVAAVGYVLFAALLRDAGDPIISTVAAALFLMAIASAVVFWVFHVSPTLSAAEEMARTSNMPAYYEVLQDSAESSLGVYQLLGLLATAGFGWALLQTGLLPSWVGWVTLGWGAVWAAVFLKTSNGFPLLPMVMQVDKPRRWAAAFSDPATRIAATTLTSRSVAREIGRSSVAGSSPFGPWRTPTISGPATVIPS